MSNVATYTFYVTVNHTMRVQIFQAFRDLKNLQNPLRIDSRKKRENGLFELDPYRGGFQGTT